MVNREKATMLFICLTPNSSSDLSHSKFKMGKHKFYSKYISLLFMISALTFDNLFVSMVPWFYAVSADSHVAIFWFAQKRSRWHRMGPAFILDIMGTPQSLTEQ